MWFGKGFERVLRDAAIILASAAVVAIAIGVAAAAYAMHLLVHM